MSPSPDVVSLDSTLSLVDSVRGERKQPIWETAVKLWFYVASESPVLRDHASGVDGRRSHAIGCTGLAY